jgi:hypothetical protein
MKNPNLDPDSWAKISLEEWDFVPKHTKGLTQQDLNLWLNYEFARSSRSIVTAVAAMKRGTKPRGSFFAAFLNRHFSAEFPKTAFHRLPAEKKKATWWQSETGFGEDCFDQNVIQHYDVFDWQRNLLHEETYFDCEVPTSHRFALMEIDFRCKDSKIVNQFKKWLKNRREQLMARYQERYPGKITGSGKQTTYTIADRYFEDRASKSNTGKRGNSREFVLALKHLAALRLLIHFDFDYFEACEYTQARSQLETPEPLFCHEETDWHRAADHAVDIFSRFVEIWPESYYPQFILDPEAFRDTFYPTLTAPFGRPVNPTADRRESFKARRDYLRGWINKEYIGPVERTKVLVGI